MKSWRTTVAGAITALVMALPEIGHAIDGSPDTIADWNVVATGVTIFVALFAARDNLVSSEKAGAKR